MPHTMQMVILFCPPPSSASLNLSKLQPSWHPFRSPLPRHIIPSTPTFRPPKLGIPNQSSSSAPFALTVGPTITPNSVRKLKQLVALKMLPEAMDLFLDMKIQGIKVGVVLESMLIDLLMKSERPDDAFRVFDEMPQRNIVTWTSMISGCVRNGFGKTGIYLFVQMLESGVLSNDFAVNAAIQACTDVAALRCGEQLHSLILRSGFTEDCWSSISLIDFYSRCGLVDRAELVFAGITDLDVVSFTSLISAYCRNNLFDSAMTLFDEMVRRGIEPNEHTITSILAACQPRLGEQLHGYMLKTLIVSSVHSATALLDFYWRNHEVEPAKLVFHQMEAKNVITWSLMISCCVRNGELHDAMRIFNGMVSAGIRPNEFTFSSILGACRPSQELSKLGSQLHSLSIKNKIALDIRVANALLAMYARCGKVQELEKLFLEIKEPDAVSWTSVISGNFQNGYDDRSIEWLCHMHGDGYMPNEYGLSSTISSCANLASLNHGRQFHCLALKLGCDINVCTGNALINLYGKCGCINDSELAFDCMHTHDIMSWNSLIYGYANNGHGREALEAVDKMLETPCSIPDESTFLGILVACSHVGYVDQAVRYFKLMSDTFNIIPSASHYACMVDIMGRAGRLEEALDIINQMPFKPDVATWKTLLGSCMMQRNLELGKLAAAKIFELTSLDSASYVLLSNLHALHGEWDDAKIVRNKMEENDIQKEAGRSWIQINNEVHSFVSRDESHPESATIYQRLEEIFNIIKSEKCLCETNIGVNEFVISV
ncbi:hypothetical protein ZIOFF_071215 [Zingiber officinale]|uniref:Chlororespiratory reduction 21 n=2 Tax=Zingiber officinale TaxID=94328 RepID=A0A8J5C3G6_ZINOF|nr:hypothetical protein ZIOFF_071215 [Zingiber officinale]